MKKIFLFFAIAGSLGFALSDLQAQSVAAPSLLVYKQDGPLVLNENPQQFVKINYRYDKEGRLIAAGGKGNFKIDDGFGNVSEGIIKQIYKIVGGQAKLLQNDTDMNTKYLDGAKLKQNITVQYLYDKDGRLQSASGSGKSTGDDGFDGKTESKISQTFLLLQGQAKLKSSRRESQTKNVDGSWKKQDVTITYTYDSKGKMTGASGSGTYKKDDGFGNVETGKIAQKYQISKGQAKLAKVNKKTFEKTIAKRSKRYFKGDPASVPAPPSSMKTKSKPEEEMETARRGETPVEEQTVHCDRGTWSPTLKRCMEETAPEEAAPPDCPAGEHWSPTLKSCQPD